MRGAIPLLPQKSSWRGAKLSTGTTLLLPYTQLTYIKSLILQCCIVVMQKFYKRFNTETTEPSKTVQHVTLKT